MRIWFNHWFSTAYRLMEFIKQGCESNNISIELIGSNRREECVYRTICDEFYIEPTNISNEDYALWCVDFCKEHNIDVFIPRRERVDITKIIPKFEEIGVKVMADSDFSLLSLLDDKFATAELFRKHNICKVPTMYIVNNVKEFEIAYNKIKEVEPNNRVCIKYNQDEGATSFRVIDDVVDNIHSLRSGVGLKLSYTKVIDILGSVEHFDDLIVMPYLEGPEISVDSLMTHKGFIGISRRKVGTRGTLVEYNKEFYDISKKFAEVSGLKMPYNMQLRHHNNDWYLLEVNTRMAGGTHKSCMTGINIPYIALCELMGIDFNMPLIDNVDKLYVSEIETPIILDLKEEK